MKMKIAILVSVALCINSLITAQPTSWTKIQSPYDTVFTMGLYSSLYYSENLDAIILNKQVLVGELVEDTGFVASEYHTFPFFDGLNWSYLSSCENVDQYPICEAITDYKDGIVTCRPACNDELSSFQGPSYFDGSQWYSLGEADEPINKLKTIDDTLYMLGFFSYVGDDYVPYVAKYTGEMWIPAFPTLPESTNEGPNFRDLIKYQGEWYLGGSINTDGSRGLFVYRNGEWQTVVGEDGEILSDFSSVQSLAVYQGELYVGGLISQAYGDVGSGIQKWDGANWSEVGGSVSGGLYPTVYEMITIGDYLYCRGNFYFVNNVPMRFLARWDGTEWCGLQNNSVEWMTTTITEWEGRLVGDVQFNPGEESAHFYMHDGDTFGPCTSTVSIEDKFDDYGNGFTIHPNPATNHFTLELSQPAEVEIHDMAGRLLKQFHAQGGSNVVDVQELGKGLYHVLMRTENGFGSEKLVVR